MQVREREMAWLSESDKKVMCVYCVYASERERWAGYLKVTKSHVCVVLCACSWEREMGWLCEKENKNPGQLLTAHGIWLRVNHSDRWNLFATDYFHHEWLIQGLKFPAHHNLVVIAFLHNESQTIFLGKDFRNKKNTKWLVFTCHVQGACGNHVCNSV